MIMNALLLLLLLFRHTFISISILIVFFTRLSNPLKFEVTRFSPDISVVLLQGDAVDSVGELELNLVNYISRVGQVTYNGQVPLYDPTSGKLADFSTHFTFTVDTQNRSSHGSGLAFFLAPAGFQIPPNSAGGFLGLFNTTTTDSSGAQIVSVEFDTSSDPGWDPPGEHVGINRNSIASLATAPWNATGGPADAYVSYNSTTKNLSVSWAHCGSPNNSTLSYRIDLEAALPEWVTVGITAATGADVERHTLQYWGFSSTLEVAEKEGNIGNRIGLIVGLSTSGFVLVVGFVLAFLFVRKRREEARSLTEADNNFTAMIMNDDLERGAGPRKFSYYELASATNSFSSERKLGEGGFGGVYKGHLIDLDLPIAVKKFSSGSKQGKNQYVTEVKIISMLRHRNLVQLIGWCHEQGEFLLVYEYMPNGSLDYHLFDKRKTPLGWNLRYRVIVGLASALLYLHEEWDQIVVHRDIKSSNIMLDSSFNVKLGDFGLARLMDHGLGHQTTGLAGTLGYLAPEYVTTGRASKESDVYSFGIVALEIATGRKSVYSLDKESQKGLVEWVWDLYGSGQLITGVDEKMKVGYDVKQVECLMIVGLWCAHPDMSLRPSIRQASRALNFEADLPRLPMRMPVAMYYEPPGHSISSGEASITVTSIDSGR